MPVDVKAIGRKLGAVTHTYTERDVMLYALGVGCGTGDLQFTYERDLKVLPTFAVIPSFKAMNSVVALVGADPVMVVHGEQSITLHRPLPAAATLSTVAEIKGAIADIDDALETVAVAIPVPAARTLVGLAGSVTTVAAIALGLQHYDPGRTHHARISADAVHEVTEYLLGAPKSERAAIGSMHPGRVDVIGAGALVLDQVMQRFGFAELVTSEHDILDGIAWSIATA